MVIEICDDIIRVSHGFKGCHRLSFMAESTTGDQGIGDDDITNF
jgi:hypothetical protein